MAQYEHLPIYRQAMQLVVHLEQVVKKFSRYNKYTLGSELRMQAHAVVRVGRLKQRGVERTIRTV